jgi:hypothetical protein
LGPKVGRQVAQGQITELISDRILLRFTHFRLLDDGLSYAKARPTSR